MALPWSKLEFIQMEKRENSRSFFFFETTWQAINQALSSVMPTHPLACADLTCVEILRWIALARHRGLDILGTLALKEAEG